MLTNRQKSFLDGIIEAEEINKDRLYKYLNTHDVVGSEIFSYCMSNTDGQLARVYRYLADDDVFYQALSVDDFIRRAPFFFFVRHYNSKDQVYKHGDYSSILHAVTERLYASGNEEDPITLEDIYRSLEFAYYDLKLSTDKIFGYWLDQTGYIVGNLFFQWIDYLHMCVQAGVTDLFPKSFIYSYNVMLCKFHRDPIVYEISESGLGDPYLRDGQKFSFEGTFPCDPQGNPVLEWIGIRVNDISDLTCTTEKSKSGYLRFVVSPKTKIHVLNFYNSKEDKEDYWYQVYAGPQTMHFDYAVLKDRRTKLKLTQQQVADAVETSVRTYQKWESGETTPDGHYLIRLMNWLDIRDVQDIIEFLPVKE